ncbi:hypothetical protein BKA56DRAFT_618142 [Ilyonectria sp. MPI-CAGE-AT-0026]|nr:hypothetical protein BKA56DRAFT_618142 [Ilyonectria sp. MPI-CAGE-AT-0026]
MPPIAVFRDNSLSQSLRLCSQDHGIQDGNQHEHRCLERTACSTSSINSPYTKSAIWSLFPSPEDPYLRLPSNNIGSGSFHRLHRRASGVDMVGLSIGMSFLFVILGMLGCVMLGKKGNDRKRKGSNKRTKRIRIRRRQSAFPHANTYQTTHAHLHGHEVYDHRHGHTRHHRSHSSRQDWTVQHPQMVHEDPGAWTSYPEPIHVTHGGPANDMDAPQDDARDKQPNNGWDWMRGQMGSD